jgi:2-polyprenyl-3-methyl-5-hydroxy-6-metoxy-1,4-benzoquinol methylase
MNSPLKIRKSYDAEAALWNQFIPHGAAFFKKRRNVYLLALLKRAKKRTILDMGCGNGMISIDLARLGFKVVGVDFSQRMIQEAKRNARGVKGLSFVHADINAHRFPSRFGAVLAISSLHNMDKQTLEKSLRSLSSLVEKNGILMVRMRHGTFEGIRTRNGIRRYYRYSNPREIKKLLAGSGLVWLKTLYFMRFNVPMFSVYFRNLNV